MLWRHRAAFLTAAVVPWFVIATTEWLPSAIYGGEEAVPKGMAPAAPLIQLLFYCMFFVTCQRTVVIGNQSGFSAFGLRLGEHGLMFIGLLIYCFIVISVPLLLIFVLLPIEMDFTCDEYSFIFTDFLEFPSCAAYEFGATLIFSMAASVFCVAFSSISIGRRIIVNTSLKNDSSNILRIFFVIMILVVFTDLFLYPGYLFVSEFVPVIHGGGKLAILYIETFIYLVGWAAIACAFSLAYKHHIGLDQSHVEIERKLGRRSRVLNSVVFHVEDGMKIIYPKSELVKGYKISEKNFERYIKFQIARNENSKNPDPDYIFPTLGIGIFLSVLVIHFNIAIILSVFLLLVAVCCPDGVRACQVAFRKWRDDKKYVAALLRGAPRAFDAYRLQRLRSRLMVASFFSLWGCLGMLLFWAGMIFWGWKIIAQKMGGGDQVFDLLTDPAFLESAVGLALFVSLLASPFAYIAVRHVLFRRRFGRPPKWEDVEALTRSPSAGKSPTQI